MRDITTKIKFKDISKLEATHIEGGFIPLAVAWGIAKIVAGVAVGSYATAYAVGKFHAHVENNK